MFRKPIRLITKLEVKGPNVIKGIQLEGLRIVGSPETLAERYYLDGIDEVIFVDIVASLYERKQLIEFVEAAGRSIFIPLTVGGGIRGIADIHQALKSGADKVSLNTSAVNNPNLINEASKQFGSQCIILSVEAKRNGSEWEVLTENGRQSTGRKVSEWVIECQERGVGEILITSVDQDGTRKGFDIELFKSVSELIEIPLIACGGCGSLNDIKMLLENTRIDAICCSSVLHFNKLKIEEVKSFIKDLGFDIR